MVRHRYNIVQPFRSNGINYSIQMRSLNWREIEARADAIVSDPARREQTKPRRGMGALDDPKAKKNPGRGKGHGPRVPGEK